MTRLLGILNLSEDSFSDGGLFAQDDAAIEHAKALHRAGAWAVDVGAVSSNPDGKGLDSSREIQRLTPIVQALRSSNIPISIDTFAPETQRWAAPRVDLLNDIRGFPDPSVWPCLADASCDLIVMHQVQRGRADRRTTDAEEVVEGVFQFFERRIPALIGAGIDRSRLIVDPGMGFFLGDTPHPSIAVLKRIGELGAATGCPVMIGVSRKSFLGALLGGRAPQERQHATLAAELYAARQGAAWIRTHDVRALHDALVVDAALRG